MKQSCIILAELCNMQEGFTNKNQITTFFQNLPFPVKCDGFKSFLWTPTEAYTHLLQITLMLFRYLWFMSWWLAMKTKLRRWQLPAKTPLQLCGLSVYCEVTYHFLLSIFYYCEKFRLFVHPKRWNSYPIIILTTWVNAACVHCYRSVLPSL